MSATVSEEALDRACTLSARNLTKVYHTGDVEVHALRGVDMDLYRGELVVLLGASGSGKSTLLNILGGLDLPTTGSIEFEGVDISKADPGYRTRYRRDHVGFVFQFYNLIPSLTALENVLLVTEVARQPMGAAKALEMVGLGERMNHFPAQLSGGEQQRVAIARAIAKQPEILLCDEPTGALDSQTGVIVLEAIDAVSRELGTTTAVITHNRVIGEMADRVIYLADGQIAHVETNETRRSPGEMSW